MIRKKRMSKGIVKILSGLLVFGMVAGLVPAVPGGTVHAKAEGKSEQNVTAEQHIHCICGKNINHCAGASSGFALLFVFCKQHKGKPRKIIAQVNKQ